MNENNFSNGVSKDAKISNSYKSKRNNDGFGKSCYEVNSNVNSNDVWNENVATDFEWRCATHVGKCVVCSRKSEHVVETELDKHERCRDHARKKKLLLGLLLGAVLALILVCVLGFCGRWLDPNAANGPYAGKSEADIVRDLNAQVADGEMNVSIANTIRFPNGSQNEGVAHIENIAANHVDQKFLIYLTDSKELVYESGAIAPNQHIDTIKLNRYLEPGRYKATAIITGYETSNGDALQDFINSLFNNHKKVGTLGAQINLVVE